MIQHWMVLFVFVSTMASASTTKVGNGDDGRDLEGATPITSGIIFETRAVAVDRLKSLNVSAIEGLGLLIPEVEKTELLMAKLNSTSESLEKSHESPDGKNIYARTFAESHSATRFYPIALTLDREQLIALHIHEGLHRALPESIRQNEDKVAQLTMAMTSPGANFDRVNRVARLIQIPQKETFVATQTLRKEEIPQPPASKIRFDIDYQSFSIDKYMFDGDIKVSGVGASFSPTGVRRIWGYDIEPVISARAYYFSEVGGQFYMGPIQLGGKLVLHTRSGATTGIFGSHTGESLDNDYSNRPWDREVNKVGVFFEREANWSFLKADLAYTFASASKPSAGPSVDFKPFTSLKMHGGAKLKFVKLGLIADLYQSNGYKAGAYQDFYGYDSYEEAEHDPFSLLVMGGSLGFYYKAVSIGVESRWRINKTAESLDSLGDIVDSGAGSGGTRIILATEF